MVVKRLKFIAAIVELRLPSTRTQATIRLAHRLCFLKKCGNTGIAIKLDLSRSFIFNRTGSMTPLRLDVTTYMGIVNVFK